VTKVSERVKQVSREVRKYMDELFIDLMTAKPYDSEANDFITFMIFQANIKTFLLIKAIF